MTDASPSASLTLHCSWTGIFAACIGVLSLVVIAVLVVAVASWVPGSIVVVVVAAVLSLVVLYDMPIATRFDSEGFERTTPLRRHRAQWSDVDRLMRTRRMVRRPGAPKTAGLVAVRGHRQTLLVDRTEGHAEHVRLKKAIGRTRAERLLDGVAEPPMGMTPTWVGRRGRWKPDAGS